MGQKHLTHSLSLILCCRAYRINDLLIAGTAAQVAAQGCTGFAGGPSWIALQEVNGRHKHSRCRTRTGPLLIYEGLLNRV